MQNGDRMYDPYMDFQIDKEAGTLRAFSYENSGIGVYNEADPDDPAYEKAINGFNSFFATLSLIHILTLQVVLLRLISASTNCRKP